MPIRVKKRIGLINSALMSFLRFVVCNIVAYKKIKLATQQYRTHTHTETVNPYLFNPRFFKTQTVPMFKKKKLGANVE